jgi:hypothetical protein
MSPPRKTPGPLPQPVITSPPGCMVGLCAPMGISRRLLNPAKGVHNLIRVREPGLLLAGLAAKWGGQYGRIHA